jgi:hypothetical protein
MKNITMLIILFALPFMAVSQVDIDSTGQVRDSVYLDGTSDFSKDEIADYLKKKKMHAGIEAGTLFGTGFGNRGYFGAFVFPHLSYPINPRFSLTTGIMISNYFGSNYLNSSAEGYHYPSGNMMHTLIYASGSYNLNERLTLSGTVYKEFSLLNHESSVSQQNNFDYKGFIMGVDYKVGKNMYFRGEIEISDSPYRRQMYHSAFPGSGFGTSSFYQPNPF